MKTSSFEKKEKNKCWLNIYGNVDERTDYLTRYVSYFSIVSSSMTITRFLKKNQITEKKISVTLSYSSYLIRNSIKCANRDDPPSPEKN